MRLPIGSVVSFDSGTWAGYEVELTSYVTESRVQVICRTKEPGKVYGMRTSTLETGTVMTTSGPTFPASQETVPGVELHPIPDLPKFRQTLELIVRSATPDGMSELSYKKDPGKRRTKGAILGTIGVGFYIILWWGDDFAANLKKIGDALTFNEYKWRLIPAETGKGQDVPLIVVTDDGTDNA